MMTSKVLKKKVIEQRSLKEDTSLGVKFCNNQGTVIFYSPETKKIKGGGAVGEFWGIKWISSEGSVVANRI